MHVLRNAALFLAIATGLATGQGLRVYGPGGPAAPLQESAKLFTQKTHILVTVTAGPEKQWIAGASGDADLIYGGAEYMLTQFELNHPGFLAAGTRAELYDRPIGILVRKGNPKGIQRLSDLGRPGVHLLDVSGAGQVGAWEDLAGRENMIPALDANIALSVRDTADAISAWNSRPDLDAWICYESWQKRLPDSTALVRLPASERLYRGTPIAVTSRSTQRRDAEAFIRFLQSPEAHAIFRKWGWR